MRRKNVGGGGWSMEVKMKDIGKQIKTNKKRKKRKKKKQLIKLIIVKRKPIVK